jgi:hypothetical protein
MSKKGQSAPIIGTYHIYKVSRNSDKSQRHLTNANEGMQSRTLLNLDISKPNKTCTTTVVDL